MRGHTEIANWVRSSFRALGSHIELIARPLFSGAADADLAALVQAEFTACERALSRFLPDSELVRLNQSLTQRKPVSKRLWEAIVLAVDAYHATKGVFDPRVITALHGLGYQGAAFDVAVGAHGMTRKECVKMWPEDESVLLYAPIDLGGVGKSYALERAAAILDQHARDYLLSAGGDIVYAGTGSGDEPWRIGVGSPFDASRLAATLQVAGRGAVCTSAASKKRWLGPDGNQRHHLIDPATMTSGGCGLASVTVITDRPTKAEVMSKVIFLRGLPGRIETGIKVLVVTEDGNVVRAGGAEDADDADDALVWTDVSPEMGPGATERSDWPYTIVRDAQTADDYADYRGDSE